MHYRFSVVAVYRENAAMYTIPSAFCVKNCRRTPFPTPNSVNDDDDVS